MKLFDLDLTPSLVDSAIAEAKGYTPPHGRMRALFDATAAQFENDVCCSDKTGYFAFTRPESAYNVSGHMVYPPGGYMTWHTNSNKPGVRVYAAWSETGDSGMLWWRDGNLVVDQDSTGWNLRAFHVPAWHCVWSRCYRVSVGINIGGAPC